VGVHPAPPAGPLRVRVRPPPVAPVGGSWCAGRRTSSPVPRHGVRAPRSRMRSRWARSDSSAPTRATGGSDSLGSGTRGSIASRGQARADAIEEFAQLAHERVCLPGFEARGERHDHIQGSLLHRVAAKCLPRAALDVVAVDRPARRAATHGHAKSRRRRSTGRDVKNGEGTSELARAAQQRTEGIATPKAVAPGKAFPPDAARHREIRRRRACGLWLGAR